MPPAAASGEKEKLGAPQTPAGGLRPPAPLLMIEEIRSSFLHG